MAKNALDAFASTPTKASKKKATKIEAKVTIKIKRAVDTVLEKKAAIKKLLIEQAEAEMTIIDHVLPQQEAEAREGNFAKSFTVMGTNADLAPLTVTWPDKFSVPKDEKVHEEIRKILAKKFDEYMEKVRTVTFTEEAMKNNKLLKALINTVVAEGMEVKDVFKIEDILKTIKGTDEKQFELPVAKLAALREFIVQAKPALK